VEPSFHVELNSTNPAEINQFVATLNALGRRFNQQAVTVYTYRGETKIEELGTKGRYGTIRPVLTIELKASLSADEQKALLDKLSEVGISGASFSADGKTLNAYDMGDLDEESPKDENWYDSARRAVEVVKAEGIVQKAGRGTIELRVYTDVPRRNATATYEQGIRSAYSQEEGRTELETWHTPTRILPTEGVTGIERGRALFNNAMVKLGFEQEYIDTTINFQMDLPVPGPPCTIITDLRSPFRFFFSLDQIRFLATSCSSRRENTASLLIVFATFSKSFLEGRISLEVKRLNS